MAESAKPAALIQLVYVSSAVRPLSEDELVELLRRSRERNAGMQLSGMLLYKDGNFMQVLEGPAAAVDELMQKVEQDPRHRGLLILSRKAIDEREFGNWSMGFVHGSAIDEIAFSTFLCNGGESWNLDDARRGRRLLSGFKTHMR